MAQRIPALVSFSLVAAVAAPSQQWFEQMEFGPAQALTVEHTGYTGNDTLKAQLLRLPDGSGVVFDTELLRMSAAWLGGPARLRLRGTPFDGAHGPMSTVVGNATAVTKVEPGWKGPAGNFDDPRDIPHGPLPRDWGRFLGHYLCGDEAVLHYQVQGAEIHEHYAVVGADDKRLVRRLLRIAPHQRYLTLRVMGYEGGQPSVGLGEVVYGKVEYTAPVGSKGETEKDFVMHAFIRGFDGDSITANRGDVSLTFPPTGEAETVAIYYGGGTADGDWSWGKDVARGDRDRPELTDMLEGGDPRWDQVLSAKGVRAPDDAAYVTDWIAHPEENPWNANMRLCAFDFFSDGRAAVTTWNGDVWVVSGIDDDLQDLKWKRFATGLYDPLGLKIVDDVVYVHGRDQLTRLHDVDDDGEADHYECFNNDVQITKAFHEFAFDLQTDKDGNFYFSKGGPVNPGGRGFMKIVPHHGTVMRVTPDGKELEVVVAGLRAPNGIGVGPNGEITTGDNEGTWMPRCRLNLATDAGFFGGVMDMLPDDMEKDVYDLPVCWMPMEVDNSSGGQVWVTSDQWGPHQGGLLHCSYGTCSLYRVLTEEVDGQVQGGVVRYPVDFRSSAMRPRFHPMDGQLYVCGFRGWQTSASTDAAFHRVRYTGKPCYLPSGLRTSKDGIELTFDVALDAEIAEDPESWSVSMWNYAWTKGYGSPEVSVLEPEREARRGAENRDPLKVSSAKLSDDGKSVFLTVPDLRPAMQLRVQYNLDAADGELMKGDLYASIHQLRSSGGAGDEK